MRVTSWLFCLNQWVLFLGNPALCGQVLLRFGDVHREALGWNPAAATGRYRRPLLAYDTCPSVPV